MSINEVEKINDVSKSFSNINEQHSSERKMQNETDTLRLLSDIRKNIENNSDQVRSIPITNYYSDNISKIGIEMKDSEKKQEQLQEEKKSLIEKSLDLNDEKNDTESSIPYLKKDDEYEDVFSNINDTVSSELLSDRNKLNKGKKKDIYFNSFNMI